MPTTPSSQANNSLEDGQLSCEDCGATFVPRVEHQRFCAYRCQKRAEKRRYQARKRMLRFGGHESQAGFDPRSTFDTERYQGERMCDIDIGAYKRALRRDPCAYCGAPCAELDHIEARSNGGHNFWDNLTAICQTCNSAKRDRSVLNFLLVRPAQMQRRHAEDALRRVGSW